jgi:hypothetical protein
VVAAATVGSAGLPHGLPKQISVLGRYDLTRFVFIPVRELGGLALGTNAVCGDEPAGFACGLHDGDVVRFSPRSPR